MKKLIYLAIITVVFGCAKHPEALVIVCNEKKEYTFWAGDYWATPSTNYDHIVALLYVTKSMREDKEQEQSVEDFVKAQKEIQSQKWKLCN
jgi:hypothetical protein